MLFIFIVLSVNSLFFPHWIALFEPNNVCMIPFPECELPTVLWGELRGS